ncbi:hypothetical protein T484DRAFT_1755591 [Baffinella frigidus]|nr:hypothetical protein T484DRAFT_1755591 [Cryptophyta sp. CCMP2293]
MGERVVLWVFMVASVYFAESLLVSALAPPARAGMRLRIPYLRSRCLDGRGGLSIPTSNPIVRGGAFHTKGRAFSTALDHTDVVKRFKMSNGEGRDTDPVPHRVIKLGGENAAVPPPNMPSGTEFKPWSIEWGNLLEVVGSTYFELGDGCSEKAYQLALLNKLYKMKIPCLVEKNVYKHENGVSILTGRVDIEIASDFVLELEVSAPTVANLRKDKKQLRRYMSAYNANNTPLERAALVYFGNFEVRIVEVVL